MTGISRDAIALAHERVRPHVRVTPVIEAEVPGVARPVAFKLELMQHAGSFKPRGAFNNLLVAEVPAIGVAAASGGNHGAAVAYAAQKLGHRAAIFVPQISPRAKLARIESYGADLRIGGANYYEALALCERHIAETGALSVHAYDTPETVAGQGTLALELEEQAGGLDTLLVAVGGGGLIGGIAAWLNGRCRIVAVEPALCPTLHAALAAGEPATVTPSGIAADSLGASRIGAIAFAETVAAGTQAVLVEEADIRAAQRWLWDRLRVVAEPGGAVAAAALLAGSYRPGPDERVGVVLCGGNTDPETFAKAIS